MASIEPSKALLNNTLYLVEYVLCTCEHVVFLEFEVPPADDRAEEEQGDDAYSLYDEGTPERRFQKVAQQKTHSCQYNQHQFVQPQCTQLVVVVIWQRRPKRLETKQKPRFRMLNQNVATSVKFYIFTGFSNKNGIGNSN